MAEQGSSFDNADRNDDSGDNAEPPPPKRQKRLYFIRNAVERSKVDSRTRLSLEKKINEWYTRTKMPVVLICLKNGEPCFSCPSELESSFSSFVNNDEVKSAFQRSIVESFARRCDQLPERSASHLQDLEALRSTIPIEADYSDYSVPDLRSLVVSAVRSSTEKNSSTWAKRESQPPWWPEDIPFLDPNNAGKKELRGDALVRVMNAFGLHIMDQSQQPQCSTGAATVSVTTTTAAATLPEASTATNITTARTTAPAAASTMTAAAGMTAPAAAVAATDTITTAPAASFTVTTTAGQGQAHQVQINPPQSNSSIDHLVTEKFGSNSVYLTASWQQVRDTCPEQRIRDLIKIMELLNEDSQCHIKLSENKSSQLLARLQVFPVNFLEDLSSLVYPHLSKPHPSFLHSYDGLQRVPEGYLGYVPPEAEGLEPFQSSGFGNCLWCSLSIIVNGDECCQNQLRLGSAVATLCHLKEFTKQLSATFCNNDEALQWASTVVSTDTIVTSLEDSQSPFDIVNAVVTREIKETLINFTDSGLFQLMMAAQFLQREIRQFCRKAGTEHYNSRIVPLIMDSPSAYSDHSAVESLNVLWVPATLGDDRFNHILPLLPWKCGCIRDDFCVFGFGLHREEKWSALRKEMVQCTFCHEWYHCCCLGYSLRQMERSALDCGCRMLSRTARHVESRDSSVYRENKKMQALVLNKTAMKNLARKLYHSRHPSLRNAIFRHTLERLSKQRDNLRLKGFGPVASDSIDPLFTYATKVLKECGFKFDTVTNEVTFAVDIFLPEAVLQVIMKNEGLNYYRANLFYDKFRP